MLLRIIAGTSLLLALLLSGCATQKGMAVLDNPATISKSSKPIYLMTVTLRNTYVKAYQPKLLSVRVAKKTEAGKPKILLIEADPMAKNESNSPTIGSSYLLRMELEPGTYSILGLTCIGQSMFVSGDFFAPIAATLIPAAPGVFYLGHIEATVRERKNDEFKAGATFPIQDQAATGASKGTFDIEITDQWETDAPKFQTKFPALTSINIQKTILPPFNRTRIQQWWEKNAFNDMP